MLIALAQEENVRASSGLAVAPEMPLGKMAVDGGDLEVSMSEQDLDRAQVCAGFKKVCR